MESDNDFNPSLPGPNRRRSTAESAGASPNAAPTKRATKPKHFIRVTDEPVASLRDQYYTQPQHGPSSSPYRIRGAIWQKPPKPAEVAPVTSIASVAGQPDRQNGAPQAQAVKPANGAARPAAWNISPDVSPETGRHAPPSIMPSQADIDLAQDLEDLPSDAFASSSASPTKFSDFDVEEVINISSQTPISPAKRLAAPQNGLRQLTLFGDPAQSMSEASQQNKKANWPMTNKEAVSYTHLTLPTKRIV